MSKCAIHRQVKYSDDGALVQECPFCEIVRLSKILLCSNINVSVSNLEKRARLWAIHWHDSIGQVRKYSGEPYWRHPEAVAALVKTVPHTHEMVAAAFLHDVIEDTPCTEEVLRDAFGDAVTDLVMWLTDVSKPSDGNREARKRIDRAHTAQAPREAQTIKLADLIDNSWSIVALDPDFARVYLREKRLLLDEALRDGDPILWDQADRITRDAMG